MTPGTWRARDTLLFRELAAKTEVSILAGRVGAFFKMDLDTRLSAEELDEISRHLELVADVSRKTSELLARIVNSERK